MCIRSTIWAVLVLAFIGSSTAMLSQAAAAPIATQLQGPDLSKPVRSSHSSFSSGALPGGRLFANRRDPFRLPPPPAPNKQAAGSESLLPTDLPPGNRGLIIGELKLEGVLWEDSGSTAIAIVTNRTHRAYFLRQNEPVYDGIVSRIAPGAVYFTERVANAKGVDTYRTVVKPLSVPHGEHQ